MNPKIAAVLLALLTVHVCAPAEAAGLRVASSAECSLVGDMALVAAALEHRQVEAQLRAALLEEIYAAPLGGGEPDKWRAILAAVVRFVARPDMRAVAPAELGTAVDKACAAARGQLEAIFGADA